MWQTSCYSDLLEFLDTIYLALLVLCDRFSCYSGLLEKHLAQKSLHFSSFVTDFPATWAYLKTIWHRNPCTFHPLWQIFLLLGPIWTTFGTKILARLILCDRFSCYSGLFEKLLAQKSLHFWSYVTDFPATRAYLKNFWHNFPCIFGPMWQIFLLFTQAYLKNIWHRNPCTFYPLWQIFLLFTSLILQRGASPPYK